MHETTTTVRIFADGDFRIAIVETKDMYEYWLNHIEYGKTEFIFGLPKKIFNYEELIQRIKYFLPNDEKEYLEELEKYEQYKLKTIKEESK